jgi:V-type H+-transporting ATPase subunit E
VVVTCGGGKIWMENTFERRLELIKEEGMPAVVETLFGKNPNRKFED